MKRIKQKAMFMIYLIIAMSFSIYLIAPAEAQTKVCCEKTKTGESCLYTEPSDCNPAYKRASSTCEQTSYCEIGCCYSEDTGQCFKNAPRTKCQEIGGTWSNDPTCSLSQCQKGCCTISDQCSFITKTMCKRETSKYPNMNMLFDEAIKTEQECTDKCKSQELGACVYSDKSCTFTTRESCLESKGEGKTGFHANMLCSNPELDTNCAKQQSTNCYQGKVYWFDSCGNRENVYNSNKEKSYNNGFVLSDERSCSASSDDKDCGNCDYSKGTICGSAKTVNPTYGDYICRDVNCKKTTESAASPDAGTPKKVGESWCIYEAAVGFGMDVVGSRHLRAKCENGEEIIEPCEDYREEFCIQTVLGGEPTTDLGSLFNLGEGFSEALCKENRANPRVQDYEDCNYCNNLDTDKKKQECCIDVKLRDCFWFNNYCSPHVPPGTEFWPDASNYAGAKSTCSEADTTVKVVFVRKSGLGLSGGKHYKCVSGCEALTKEWAQEMNRRCVAQGDCGAWYNIEGELTLDGFEAVGGGKGKYAYELNENDLPNWEEIINPPKVNKDSSTSFANLFAAAIPIAYLATYVALTTGTTYMAYSTATLTAAGVGVKTVATTAGPNIFGALGNVPILGALGPVGWIAAAAYFVASIIDLAGYDKANRYITVSCDPWEAPDTSKDCEKCNTGLAPCTEYRCRSLGKFCEIINENSENEKCVYKDPYDIKAPIITSAQQTYKYTETDLGYTIKEEIPINTPLTLAISTNEPAECRFSLEQNIPYKQMEVPFGETFYDYNHSLIINLPSELQEEEILKLTNGGQYALYVKCEDNAKNANAKDYLIKFKVSKGPDLQPAKVELSSIKNGAYIAADKDKIDFSIFLNEPASCRWSISDVDYTSMINTFTCAENGFDISSVYYGLYECKTTLDIEKEKVNNYFFRCIDKANNVNTESMPVDGKLPFSLISTIPLKITSIAPSGKIYTANPVLTVTTSEGAENGVAFCGYSEKDDEIYNMIGFFDTNSTTHKQQLAGLTSGTLKYYIKCVDKAGNVAETNTTLDIEADLTAPKIYKAYVDSVRRILVLETSEETTCEYAAQAFNYGSGTQMTGTLTQQHQANLQDIFYVICQDKYNNQLSVVIYP